MINGITRNQWLGIIVVILGAVAGGSAQLNNVVGPGVTQLLVSLATLLNTIMGGIIVNLGGQGQQIKDVAAMPGVDRVSINENASAAAAIVAVDPQQTKVGAVSPEVRQVLINKASS